jgi:2,4-dienoyl-CoA reductase-like NADH-dependent reductase (Old Yellow Enzyme family)
MTAPHLLPLIRPLKVGNRTLRNRVVVTAHATRNIDAERLPNDDDVAYFAERAYGGAAMVTMGTTAVHPSSPTPYGIYHNFDDRIIPRYEALSAAVHAHGALIVPQLGHMGGRADGGPGGVWAPSRVSHHTKGSYPHVMSKVEIRVVVQAYASAAARAVAGGMDGVEISVGHGQLVNLFLSPLTNQRDDEYGGSAGSRFRFCREVLTAVREAIGDALLVVRVNGSDEVDGSLDQDAWLDIDQLISEERLADAMNVSVSFGGSVIPTMAADHGCYLHYARAVRERVDLPVGAVGRITDPAMAAQALVDGDADFVGMTRAHIADPHIVDKIRSGRHLEIRPCIGCLQMCQGELQRNLNVKCVYNPVTGFERSRRDVESSQVEHPRHVVVVGGGPAGMETARVSASRGHRVTLLEKRSTLGGAVLTAARTPGRAELANSVAWLSAAIDRLGVDVRVGSAATAESIRALNPDVVVLATGALSAMPVWAGSGHARVVGAREVVSATVLPSGDVVVIDDDNRSQGLAAAIAAGAQGCSVTLVTSANGPGEHMEPEVRNDFLVAMRQHDITFLPRHRVLQLTTGDRLGLLLAESGHDQLVMPSNEPPLTRTIQADWVVSTWAAPDDALLHALGDDLDVRAVGDVLSPHRIEAAVHDAFELARTL